MTKICKVAFNNETFLMNCGDLLLDELAEDDRDAALHGLEGLA